MLIGVAVLAGISAGVLAAAVWARDTIRAQDDNAAAHVATTYPSPGDCTAADLDVTFTAPESVSSGAGMTINVTVNNIGDDACLIDVGGRSLGAVITSGDQTIWTSTDCPATPTSRRLLVAAGTSAAATLTWDGRAASACTPIGAQAGVDTSPTDTADTPDAEATDASDPETTAAASSDDASVATAGTYRVRIQLEGTDLTENRVFVVE
ncbi:hypothetical protein RWX45_10570 [Actinomyces sp. MRS3W]|nr:hypothetical protein [Actinomyces sp. MRS3W]